MGYYSDLFLRPKQAVAYAYDHPSIVRSLGFVIMGTLLGLVGTFLLLGEVSMGEIIGGLSGDLARWLLVGLLLVLIGVIFRRISFSGQNVTRALTLLAQLNVYGFFIFLIMGILFPVFVIPDLVVAASQANGGLIGPEEFNAAIAETLSQPGVPIVGGILFILTFILILYSIYVMFLCVQKYLDISSFKAIAVMLLLLVIQSAFAFVLLA